jgi:predicted DsbA family dithiol-disulfide isomerase
MQTIEVYHDVACPWCRIGKAYLRQALARWAGPAPTVRYRTFFLNADIPSDGYEFVSYMNAKGGGQVPLEQWFAAPRAMGAAAGLTFHFERITRAPNTLQAHRLIALTPEPDRAGMIDALYDAYFEHGRDIGDLDTLHAIARVQGVAVDLQGDQARDQVLAEADQAHRLGISGVPFFVFNQRYGLGGAQPVDVLLQVMEQVNTSVS